MNKTARKCIFCDAGNLSEEHIFSEWMHPLLEGQHEYNISLKTYSNYDHHPSIQHIRRLKPRQGSVLNKRILRICERCNNEWMSGIEKKVQNALTSLINGEKTHLSAEERQLIATWFCMRTIVLEYDDRETRAATKSDRNFLYQQKSPPPNWFILVSSSETVGWRAKFRHYGLSISAVEQKEKYPNNNAQVTTFGIGKIVGQTISYHDDFASYYVKIYANHVGHKILWPPSDAGFDWPTKSILNDKEVEDFSNEFAFGLASLHGN